MIKGYVFQAIALFISLNFVGTIFFGKRATDNLPEVQAEFNQYAPEAGMKPLQCNVHNRIFSNTFTQCDAITQDQVVVSFKTLSGKRFTRLT